MIKNDNLEKTNVWKHFQKIFKTNFDSVLAYGLDANTQTFQIETTKQLPPLTNEDQKTLREELTTNTAVQQTFTRWNR